MRKLLSVLLLTACLVLSALRKPKLIVAIVIDQFRYDLLLRYRSEYHGGFEQLLTKGAVFTNAKYIHFPTVTGVGHSTFLSGALPSVSGVVGNDWFDREENKHVTCVSDTTTKVVGGAGSEGASPHRMLVSTVGDELKMMVGRKSHVIGISLKDRSAILPAGHMADAAYWFDLKSGNFVTSSYYMSDLPGWAKDFNHSRPSDKFRGTTWQGHAMPQDLKEYYGDSTTSPFESSPYGNEVMEQFVERALSAEQLGKHEATDILAVSYSSNDKVGHDYGTYSAEEHDVTVKTDEFSARLFHALDQQVGLGNVLIVLTGDHGVAPSEEEDQANRMPGGRILPSLLKRTIQEALAKKYGAGEWVAGSWDLSVYLQHELIRTKNLDPAEVRRVAADALMSLPHVARAYTREQLLSGTGVSDPDGRRMMQSYNLRRGPDIELLPDPFWVVTDKASSHGTTYSYDSHVPVVFMGPGIRPGRYDVNIAVNDVAPTLATILEVETPSGSIGRVLTEMWAPGASSPQ
jgi:arylsulfatase A-like enzyme